MILFCMCMYVFPETLKIIIMPEEGTTSYSPDGVTWKKAAEKVICKDRVYVKTDSDSKGAVYFPGECTIKLISDTFIRIENREIYIFRGSSWYKVEKNNRKFKYSTKSVLVGVWGTEFEIEVKEPDNHFLVYEGVISLKGKQKTTIKLDSGYIHSSNNGFFKDRKKLLSQEQLSRLRQKWDWGNRLGMNSERGLIKDRTTPEKSDTARPKQPETMSGVECYINGQNSDMSTAFGPDCNRTRFDSQCIQSTRSGPACGSSPLSPQNSTPYPSGCPGF